MLSDGELSSEEELPPKNVISSSGSKIVGTVDLLSDSLTDSSCAPGNSSISERNAAFKNRLARDRMIRRQRESRLPESQTIAKARNKPPSIAGSVTGELQQGLRQLDFSSPTQRPQPHTQSEPRILSFFTNSFF